MRLAFFLPSPSGFHRCEGGQSTARVGSQHPVHLVLRASHQSGRSRSFQFFPAKSPGEFPRTSHRQRFRLASTSPFPSFTASQGVSESTATLPASISALRFLAWPRITAIVGSEPFSNVQWKRSASDWTPRTCRRYSARVSTRYTKQSKKNLTLLLPR
jgi:hypothetical protein